MSLDGGGTRQWTPTSIGDIAALLLRSTDWMRLVPNGRNGTTATFSYVAWDRTTGVAGGQLDITDARGGTTAFSLSSETVTMVATSVNDAPVLMPAAPTLPTITEEEAANTGQSAKAPKQRRDRRCRYRSAHRHRGHGHREW